LPTAIKSSYHDHHASASSTIITSSTCKHKSHKPLPPYSNQSSPQSAHGNIPQIHHGYFSIINSLHLAHCASFNTHGVAFLPITTFTKPILPVLSAQKEEIRKKKIREKESEKNEQTGLKRREVDAARVRETKVAEWKRERRKVKQRGCQRKRMKHTGRKKGKN
jgi:hypothetical protein